MGIDPEVLRRIGRYMPTLMRAQVAMQVISNSSGRSLMTETRIPKDVLTRNFDYGFKLGLMHKDVRIANRCVGVSLCRGPPTAEMFLFLLCAVL